MHDTLSFQFLRYGRGWMIATTPGPEDGADCPQPARVERWTETGWAPEPAAPMFFPTERDATEYARRNRDRM